MTDAIKMRVTLSGDVATVKALIPHPMETGLRKDPLTGEIVPMHFIHHVVALHNDIPVLDAQWSRSVSKNPFVEFRVRAAKSGDRITLIWEDNRGATGRGETVIK